MEKREIFERIFFLGAGTLLVIAGLLMVLGFSSAVAFGQEQSAAEKPAEVDVMIQANAWTYEVGNVKFIFTKPNQIVAQNGQAKGVYVEISRQNDDGTWRLLAGFHLASTRSKNNFGNLLSSRQEESLGPAELKNGTFQKGDKIRVQVETTGAKAKELGTGWTQGLTEVVTGGVKQKVPPPAFIGNTIITLKE